MVGCEIDLADPRKDCDQRRECADLEQKLEAQRPTEAPHAPELGRAELAQTEAGAKLCPSQQQDLERVSDHGRPSDSGDAPLEPEDEPRIERDVGEVRSHGSAHRGARVGKSVAHLAQGRRDQNER